MSVPLSWLIEDYFLWTPTSCYRCLPRRGGGLSPRYRCLLPAAPPPNLATLNLDWCRRFTA